MAPGQGPGTYRGGKETRKSPAKATARKRAGSEQSTKEHQETNYGNTTLARQTLARRIGVKDIEAITDKRYPSHSIANTIGGKNPRAPRRPNKGRKYNSNTPKDRGNRSKRLALLNRCPSGQPKV